MTVPGCSVDDLWQLKQQIGNIEIRIHAPYMGVDTGKGLEHHANLRIQDYAYLKSIQKNSINL